MKMKKYSFIVLLALNSSIMPVTEHQENILKRQYKSLKNDLELIKKCYGTNLPACTDNERKEARGAALRVGSKAAGIVGIVLVVSGLGTVLYMRLKKEVETERAQEAAKAESQQQLEALKESIKKEINFEIVDIQKNDNVIDIIVELNVEAVLPKLSPYEDSINRLVKAVYPTVRLVNIKNPTKKQSYPILILSK
jgi:hypothetical protein